jgi:hypothetical protein
MMWWSILMALGISAGVIWMTLEALSRRRLRSRTPVVQMPKPRRREEVAKAAPQAGASWVTYSGPPRQTEMYHVQNADGTISTFYRGAGGPGGEAPYQTGSGGGGAATVSGAMWSEIDGE